jgi:hypothetical protein
MNKLFEIDSKYFQFDTGCYVEYVNDTQALVTIKSPHGHIFHKSLADSTKLAGVGVKRLKIKAAAMVAMYEFSETINLATKDGTEDSEEGLLSCDFDEVSDRIVEILANLTID